MVLGLQSFKLATQFPALIKPAVLRIVPTTVCAPSQQDTLLIPPYCVSLLARAFHSGVPNKILQESLIYLEDAILYTHF